MLPLDIIMMSLSTLAFAVAIGGFITHKTGNKKLNKKLETTMIVLIGLFIGCLLVMGWESILK